MGELHAAGSSASRRWLQERVQAVLLLITVKILYVSQYFPPEMGAPAARAVELARHWVRAGHDVTVLTGFPNDPTGVVPPNSGGRGCAISFIGKMSKGFTWFALGRCLLPNRKAHERMLNYGSFCVSAAWRGMELSRPDVVIATSPQLLVGLSGWWISFWKRVPFIFEVRDLWPESLSAVGGGSTRATSRSGRDRRVPVSHADRIVVVTPAFQDHLTKHWQLPGEISVVENGVESSLFTPEAAEAALKERSA